MGIEGSARVREDLAFHGEFEGGRSSQTRSMKIITSNGRESHEERWGKPASRAGEHSEKKEKGRKSNPDISSFGG